MTLRSSKDEERTAVQLFKTILVVVIAAIACPQMAVSADYHYKVPGAKAVLGITASPTDSVVAVFTTNNEESEETGSGNLTIVDLTNSKILRFPKLESSQIDLNAIWKKDGRHILFETRGGVFEADRGLFGRAPQLVINDKTTTHGIGLSESESKLAFWKWEKSSLQLVVRDAMSSTILRRWTLPLAYGGETNGFEIAFQGENTIYARTFDNESRTPLKSFDLITGKVETVARDCMALAASSTAIYYIDNSSSTSTLKKLTNGKPEAIALVTGYDDLRATAGGQWIALSGSGKSAIFDPASDRISAKSSCDYMTALSDGTPLYVNKATLSSDSAICPRHR